VVRRDALAIDGDGGELGRQLLLDSQGLAVLLLCLRVLPKIAQQDP
jgi:hypothetical protein